MGTPAEELTDPEVQQDTPKMAELKRNKFVLDPILAEAVNSVESNFNSRAVSKAKPEGAIGDMQVMPDNLRRLAPRGSDWFDPKVNIPIGMEMLNDELIRYKGDVKLALAAYNWGAKNLNYNLNYARKQGAKADYNTLLALDHVPVETRGYVTKVLETYDKLQGSRKQSRPEGESFFEQGSVRQFQTDAADLLTKDGFDRLDIPNQLRELDKLYKSRKWDQEVGPLLQRTTEAMWGDTPAENRGEILGRVDNHLALVAGDDDKTIDSSAISSARNFKTMLQEQGENPYLYGDTIDKAFSQKAEIEKYNKAGVVGTALGFIGATAKETAGKAIQSAGRFVGGAADLYGAEETAKMARTWGEDLVKDYNPYIYDLNPDGTAKIGEDGRPVKRWAGLGAEVVGNLVPQVAAFKGLGMLAGAAFSNPVTAAAATLLGGIALVATQNAGDAYELHTSVIPGDREGGLAAAYNTLDESAGQGVADLVMAGTGAWWARSLSGLSRSRFIATNVAKQAAAGYASTRLQLEGVGSAVEKSTGGLYKRNPQEESTMSNIGAIVGGVFGAVEGRNHVPTAAPATKPTAPATPAVDTEGYSPNTNVRRPPIPSVKPTDSKVVPKPVITKPVRPKTIEEMTDLGEALKLFNSTSRGTMIVDNMEPHEVPPSALEHYQLEASPMPGGKTLLSRKTSWERGDIPKDITQLDGLIDGLTNEIVSSPNPNDQRVLESQLQSAAVQRKGLRYTKEVAESSLRISNEKQRLEKQLAETQKTLDRTKATDRREPLQQEISSIQGELQKINDFMQTPEGRPVAVEAAIAEAKSKLEMLNDPLYRNNTAAKEDHLGNLLHERDRLVNAEGVKTTTEDVSIPLEDGKRLVSLNNKWYVIKKKGLNTEVPEGAHNIHDALYGLRKKTTVTFAEPKQKVSGLDADIAKLRATGKTKGKLSRIKDEALISDANLTPEQRRNNFILDDLEKMESAAIKREDLIYSGPPGPDDGTQSSTFTSAGRVRIDPLSSEGEPFKSHHEINREMTHILQQGIQRGNVKAGDLGNYNPKFQSALVKYDADMLTRLHEILHAKDDQFGVSKIAAQIPEGSKGKLHEELSTLGKGGSAHPDKPHAYNMREGAAEGMLSWMIDPNYTEQRFPEFMKQFKANVSEENQIAMRNLGDDIRRWADAPAIQQVMGHIVGSKEAIRQNIPEHIKSYISGARRFFSDAPDPTKEFKTFNVSGVDKFTEDWLNPNTVFDKAVGKLEAARGEKLLPHDDPRVLMSLLLGANSKTNKILTEGIPDPIKRVGYLTKANFSDFRKFLKKDTTENMLNEARMFNAIMVAEHTIELHGQRDANIALQAEGLPKIREMLKDVGPLSGIAGSSNIEAKGMTEMEVAQRVRREVAKMSPDVQLRSRQWAKHFREIGDGALNYGIAKGVVDPNVNRDEMYVTMMRELSDEQLDGVLTHGTKAIYAKEGSSAPIKDPTLSLFKTATRIIRIADRNEATLAFTDLLDLNRKWYGPQSGVADIGFEISAQQAFGDKTVTKVFDQGKARYYKLNEHIRGPLEGFKDLAEDGVMMDVFSAPGKLLKASMGVSPVFAINNYRRDIMDRLILSDTPLIDKLATTFDVTKKVLTNKLYSDVDTINYQLLGGDQGGHYPRNELDYMRSMRNLMNEVSADKNSVLFLPTKIGSKYVDIVQQGEIAGRVAEYKAQFKRAKTKLGYGDVDAHLYAAYKAVDLMPFAVIGHNMRQFEKIVPYTNARLQGFRKLIRAAKENPGGLALTSVVYGAIPVLLMRKWNEAHGYGDAYEKQPDYAKDMSFILYAGPNTNVVIPKPFSGMMVTSAVDRLYSYHNGNKDAFNGFAGMLAAQTLPLGAESIPILFRPTIEALLNTDTFRKKNVQPIWDVNKSLGERKPGKGESRFGQWVQKAAEMMGLGDNWAAKRLLAARSVDHQMKGYFGSSATVFLSATDYGRGDGGRPLSWNTVTGITKEVPVYGTKDVEEVMSFATNHGISTQNKYLRYLQDSINRYFDADGAGAKKQAYERVYTMAQQLNESIKKNGVNAFGQVKKY